MSFYRRAQKCAREHFYVQFMFLVSHFSPRFFQFFSRFAVKFVKQQCIRFFPKMPPLPKPAIFHTFGVIGLPLLVDELIGRPGFNIRGEGGILKVGKIEVQIFNYVLNNVALVEFNSKISNFSLYKGFCFGEMERTSDLLNEQFVFCIEEMPAEGAVEVLQDDVVYFNFLSVILQCVRDLFLFLEIIL